MIQELGGIEKIDIIQYQEGIQAYIEQALSPAKNIRVVIDQEKKLARVFAPKEELSLAIGKEGQNVRLASKLTGYAIEIEEEPGAQKEEAAIDEVETKEVEAKSNLADAKEQKAATETKKPTKKRRAAKKKKHEEE